MALKKIKKRKETIISQAGPHSARAIRKKILATSTNIPGCQQRDSSGGGGDICHAMPCHEITGRVSRVLKLRLRPEYRCLHDSSSRGCRKRRLRVYNCERKG
ncbi:jg8256 [Pararge aegeria aegeria]|uniref:Jg8256 protein n=1 Tax=Pararge aegeria aegeria TaxID=348720 RepID=A0A8S4RN98_9NEOP|nr:jg8256 [Pararge aegeria aegeria]